ncbi:hypothetical protein AZF37_03560 [endosymbiont 'TC1' of Trimyema compressum]|uniref:DUF4190 domain-containing protein n=1 Tax=endosymbiont 'TC1' of Trimyema compressum TaxID=243899 RepID=UPI0007F0F2DC|nr:DUF4190 domain-containing protein [endosymbiont 'TC1' of Trimyema compressum]AMP20366.1 hypothetical protein AZF37_03560 [endosymbiont 'TC1' of Trimyema compressum]
MEQSNKGLAIASLVLGIIGILTSFFCMCFMPFIAPFLGIPGLVLGIIGIRKKEGGMAIAGTILSSITLILSLIFLMFWGVAVMSDGSNFFSNIF